MRCAFCGYEITAPPYECERCDQEGCPDCVADCEGCGKLVCREHAVLVKGRRYCHKCGVEA